MEKEIEKLHSKKKELEKKIQEAEIQQYDNTVVDGYKVRYRTEKRGDKEYPYWHAQKRVGKKVLQVRGASARELLEKMKGKE